MSLLSNVSINSSNRHKTTIDNFNIDNNNIQDNGGKNWFNNDNNPTSWARINDDYEISNIRLNPKSNNSIQSKVNVNSIAYRALTFGKDSGNYERWMGLYFTYTDDLNGNASRGISLVSSGISINTNCYIGTYNNINNNNNYYIKINKPYTHHWNSQYIDHITNVEVTKYNTNHNK